MDSDILLHFLFGIPCGLLELYISIKKYSPSSKDRGTIFILWLIIGCSQIFSIRFIRLGYGSKIIENEVFKKFLWLPSIICLYVIGHIIRQQSIRQLGQWFSTVIRTDDNHELIDSGWYGIVRHPSYTGALMYFLALALLLNNWIGLFGMMIPISGVFIYRISIEENELKKHFGIKYQNYQKKVPKKIIPKIF